MKKSVTKTFLIIVFFPFIVNSQCWNKVSSIGSSALAIKNDGTLWSFGYNFYGQIGDGTTINRNYPVQIGNENNWLHVYGGEENSAAIKQDGSLWRWGKNYPSTENHVPTQFGLDTWVSITNSYYHTLGLKQNGTIWAWGNNGFGALGVGGTIPFSETPIQIGTNNTWESICTGYETSYAIKQDGSLWAWGANYEGLLGVGFSNYDVFTPLQIGTANDWKNVYAGFDYAMALKDDGTLWAWGRNEYYFNLGDGTNTNTMNPIQIGNDTWKSVSCSTTRTIGIKMNGTLWTWGGEYGSPFSFSMTPVQIGSSNNWKSAQACNDHYIAIQNDGSLWSWGYNTVGQLGLNTNNDVSSFIPSIISCSPPLDVNDNLFDSDLIVIFPNPFNDILQIKSKSFIKSIEIFNVSGKKIIENHYNNDIKILAINLSSLNNSLYCLKITLDDNSILTKKIIKN